VLHLFTRRNVIKSLYLEGAASFAILIEKIFWHICLSKCLFFGSATFNISVCLFISQKGIVYLIWVLWFLKILFVCHSKKGSRIWLFWYLTSLFVLSVHVSILRIIFFVKKIFVHCFWNSCLSSIKIKGNEKDWYLLQKFKELLWACWFLF